MPVFMLRSAIIALVATGCITAYAADTNATDHKLVQPKDIKWTAGPDALPKGAEITVLEGDPSQSGPFTIRLKFPAKYQISPHFHPVTEHLTVISGNFYMGMGDKYDEKNAKEIPTGGFAYMQPEVHHYAFTKGKAIIQLHGEGPWGITYVNADQDPRNKKDKT